MSERSRRRRGFHPQTEAIEERLLLTATRVAAGSLGFLRNPGGTQAVRPNTPVLPFGAPLSTATFLDPSAHILNGEHVIVGQKSFVGPYALLNANSGYIKIGSGSAVLDNAVVASNPTRVRSNPPSVLIGDSTQIGFGATVRGPSVVGAYLTAAAPTGVGANALVDGATISPGSVVGVLARVGPGVTVPPGMYVLPGVDVTTNAEASDPALGKVAPLPASILADLKTELTRNSQLAAGYTNLYQGNPATGLNPGVDPTVTNVFNGNLAAVLGAGQNPGPATTAALTGINFEPRRASPRFPGPHKPQNEAVLPNFQARVTGDARFAERANVVNHRVGRGNAFRADQGQPLVFAGAPTTGRNVTINSPLGGSVTTGGALTPLASSPAGITYATLTGTTTKVLGAIDIGENFRTESNVVILGGPAAAYAIGDNVTVGAGAVVERSSLGAGATIGAKAYVSDSNVAAGASIPPGTILIHDTVVGRVQW